MWLWFELEKDKKFFFSPNGKTLCAIIMYLDLLRESGRVIGSGLHFFHPYSSVKQSTCFAKIHRTFTVWVAFKCTSLFLKDNLKTKFIFYLHYHFLANPKKSNVFTTTSFFCMWAPVINSNAWHFFSLCIGSGTSPILTMRHHPPLDLMIW